MPVNITEEFVRFLMKQNEEQSARIAELSAEITSLNQTIRELKEQLNKNSKNSSKPPLSDGLKKHDCKTQTAPVIIGNNVWIGGGAIILPKPFFKSLISRNISFPPCKPLSFMNIFHKKQLQAFIILSFVSLC